jgi:hypothetical protein
MLAFSILYVFFLYARTFFDLSSTLQVKEHMTYVHSHLQLRVTLNTKPLMSSLYIHSTKFAIYATLNRRVNDHGSVLDDREKVLDEVQIGLVKDGGVLI